MYERSKLFKVLKLHLVHFFFIPALALHAPAAAAVAAADADACAN